MAVVYHLTANGWNEDPSGRAETLEAWLLTVEINGATRLTRWTCIAYARHLSMEERSALHKRFGAPPVFVSSPEIDDAGLTAAVTV